MRFAVILSFAATGLLLFLAVGARSSDADGGGILTHPLQTPIKVNSYFDHHNPSNRYTLPFTRWDGFAENQGHSFCYRNPDGSWNCPCDPINDGDCYNGHEGVDFSTGALNLPVYATAVGIVDGQPADNGDGFGKTVKLSHPGVNINTRYSHLLNWVVTNGQPVQRGQLVGYAGSSGTATGVHLHFGAYNAPSGGTYIDPYGWTYATAVPPPPDTNSGPDPWSYDSGHLWATRIGYFNSGGFQVKEGQINAGYDNSITLPGSGPVTAMSIDGSRIAIVQGGTAYARDTSLNTANLGRPASNNWQTMYTNAIDIKLAGNRVGVVRSDNKLVMKEGPLNAAWYENPVVADNVQKLVLTPDRIGVLHFGGTFKMKDHGPITGPWYVMMDASNGVADVALTDEWIGGLTRYGCVDCFQAKETLNGYWQVMEPGGVVSITMGGKDADRRMGEVAGGLGKAKEWSLNGSWTNLGSAVEVALNSGRAARRQSNGNIYVGEGENLATIGSGDLVGTGSGVRLN